MQFKLYNTVGRGAICDEIRSGQTPITERMTVCVNYDSTIN